MTFTSLVLNKVMLPQYCVATSMCINVLKCVIDYNTSLGSHVFTFFVDFSKALDRFNYWKLFNSLLDDYVNTFVINMLSFWYTHQDVAVKWLNVVSHPFKNGNGTRHCSPLSPFISHIH